LSDDRAGRRTQLAAWVVSQNTNNSVRCDTADQLSTTPRQHAASQRLDSLRSKKTNHEHSVDFTSRLAKVEVLAFSFLVFLNLTDSEVQNFW